MDVGPFNLALGRPASAIVRGQLSRSGYNFQVQGDAEVQRLLEVARTIGLPALQTCGQWRSSSQPSGRRRLGWICRRRGDWDSPIAFRPGPGARLEPACRNFLRQH